MDWKQICRKWLVLPWWALLLLTAVSTVGLVMVFSRGWDEHPVAYVTYVLSFYTLTVDCIGAWGVVPGWLRKVKRKVYANQFGNRYMTDAAFKTQVSLYQSLLINLAYVAVNLLNMYWNRSAWFGILAFYYSILAGMRFLLVRYVRKNEIGTNLILELKRSRACAWILLTLNLVLSGAVLMILYQNRGFRYPGILIYVMAGYTFYITIHAVVDIVKYRKFGSPVMSTAKIISLCAAMVSMLSLETAMFSQFGGDMAPENRRIMVAATGAGVSAVVVSLSVYLIVRATKEIRNRT